MIQITQINIYPVKSLQGISLEKAKLGVRGLEWDRHWMIVDHHGVFLSQRETPQMATISVLITENSLILEHSSVSPLIVPLRQKQEIIRQVRVWDDVCTAFDEGEEASDWLTKILGESDGKPVHLVRFPPKETRPVNAEYLRGESSHTAFADGFPYLVISEESLELLNENLVKNGASKVNMGRFRTNLVIRGVKPLEEDTLEILSSSEGRYSLRICKPCSRCPITTTDQKTGQRPEPKEPLKTLAQMNTQPDLVGVYFGQNAILLEGENLSITVGDQIKTRL